MIGRLVVRMYAISYFAFWLNCKFYSSYRFSALFQRFFEQVLLIILFDT